MALCAEAQAAGIEIQRHHRPRSPASETVFPLVTGTGVAPSGLPPLHFARPVATSAWAHSTSLSLAIGSMQAIALPRSVTTSRVHDRTRFR
jgi:hypothetical protein